LARPGRNLRAREGADVLIAYLNEHDDAKETERLVKDAGRKAVLVLGEAGSIFWSTTPPIKASINSDIPNPTLLAYATTKGAVQNFTAGLAQLLAEKGIRANTRY
jgi:NAD(P)-dependent dehydrogenase (short-subunit alcohol dehydrogenase family)